MSQDNSLSEKSKPHCEYFPCKHQKSTIFKKRNYCYDCGLLIIENETSYKSHQMSFGVFYDPEKQRKACIKNRVPKVEVKEDTEYFKQRSHLIEFMWDIAEKLKLQINTIHLSIYFMDFICNQITVTQDKLQLYASTCVMLAAKSVELDERIPFISKLKRYSGLFQKTIDFTRVEQTIISQLKWNLQCVTIIDLIQFYLTQGVVFGSDTLDETLSNDIPVLKEKKMNQQDNLQSDEKNQSSCILSDQTPEKIIQPVKRMEYEYIRLANIIIRDHRFYEFGVNQVAAAAICYLRKITGLSPVWNINLENLTTLNDQDIEPCLNLIEQKFGKFFAPQKCKTIDISSQNFNENKFQESMQSKLLSKKHSQSLLYTNPDIQKKPFDFQEKQNMNISKPYSIQSQQNDLVSYNTYQPVQYNVQQNYSYVRHAGSYGVYQPQSNYNGIIRYGSNIH